MSYTIVFALHQPLHKKKSPCSVGFTIQDETASHEKEQENFTYVSHNWKLLNPEGSVKLKAKEDFASATIFWCARKSEHTNKLEWLRDAESDEIIGREELSDDSDSDLILNESDEW